MPSNSQIIKGVRGVLGPINIGRIDSHIQYYDYTFPLLYVSNLFKRFILTFLSDIDVWIIETVNR